MIDDDETKLRDALALPAPPPELFSLGVMTAYHRTREHRGLVRRYAAMTIALLSLGLSALPLAVLLPAIPVAFARGGVTMLLLAAAVAWSFAAVTRPSPQR